MIDLEAIRARDADYNDVFEAQASMSKDIAHRLVAWPVADRRALLAAYDALAAENAALRKDAARYRFIRSRWQFSDAEVDRKVDADIATAKDEAEDESDAEAWGIEAANRADSERAQRIGRTNVAEFDLEAIRARDALVRFMDYATAGDADRRALLKAYDELREAAREMDCYWCRGSGKFLGTDRDCDRCADLRRLLEGGGK